MAVRRALSAASALLLLAPSLAATPRTWDVQIAPGVRMPYVSLGHPDDNSSVAEGVAMWLSLGGVGLDTAWSYRNQRQVSLGVALAGKTLDDVFITTKIPCAGSASGALAFVRENLRELRAKRLDLVLIHSPCDADAGNRETWRGLQAALGKGLARAIGVSNFLPRHLDAVLSAGGPGPAVNQCLMSVGHHDDATIAYGRARNVTYEAYSPLRHADLKGPALVRIAAAHGKSAAQVALRWVLQQGVPLATSPGGVERFARDDLELDSFELTGEEMEELAALR